MPSGGNHPILSTQSCLICKKLPSKSEDRGGYIFYFCEHGSANSGWTTQDAISNWNYFIDNQRDNLLSSIANKLRVF